MTLLITRNKPAAGSLATSVNCYADIQAQNRGHPKPGKTNAGKTNTPRTGTENRNQKALMKTPSFPCSVCCELQGWMEVSWLWGLGPEPWQGWGSMTWRVDEMLRYVLMNSRMWDVFSLHLTCTPNERGPSLMSASLRASLSWPCKERMLCRLQFSETTEVEAKALCQRPPVGRPCSAHLWRCLRGIL